MPSECNKLQYEGIEIELSNLEGLTIDQMVFKIDKMLCFLVFTLKCC